MEPPGSIRKMNWWRTDHGQSQEFNDSPDIEIIPRVPENALFGSYGRVLIKQMSLLENCITPADGMTKIWLIVTEDGDQVKFSVEDDGAGIKFRCLKNVSTEVSDRDGKSG